MARPALSGGDDLQRGHAAGGCADEQRDGADGGRLWLACGGRAASAFCLRQESVPCLLPGQRGREADSEG